MKDISSPGTLPHYPVMLEQVLEVCQPEKGGLFVDCTFGSGGYSNAILSFPETKVIALDRDYSTQHNRCNPKDNEHLYQRKYQHK